MISQKNYYPLPILIKSSNYIIPHRKTTFEDELDVLIREYLHGKMGLKSRRTGETSFRWLKPTAIESCYRKIWN
jgi:hypothetical protein